MGFYNEDELTTMPAVLVILLFMALVLAFLLHDKPRRVRQIPTMVIAVALLVLEGIKQRWNALGGFDAYMLPLHYCTLFVILIPLAELCGERLSRFFRPAAAAMCFIVSMAMYSYPSGILGIACEHFGIGFEATHTFVFHHLLVLYLFLTVALGLCKPRLRDAITVGAAGVAYAMVGIPCAYIFQENYCNYLSSAIPFIEDLRLAYGQVVHAVVITLFITIGAMVGTLIYIAIHRLIALCFFRNATFDE